MQRLNNWAVKTNVSVKIIQDTTQGGRDCLMSFRGCAVDKVVENAHTIGAELVMLGHKHGDDWLGDGGRTQFQKHWLSTHLVVF